jgi:hypothetical protein
MATKPKPKARRKASPAPALAYPSKKCVRIEEADNGFTVSTYGPKGETSYVAKSEAGAMRHARTLLGKK